MTLKLALLNKRQPKQRLPPNAPSIDEIYVVFKKYEGSVLEIMRTSSESWPALVHNRKEVLKAELTNMGLADRIKWN